MAHPHLREVHAFQREMRRRIGPRTEPFRWGTAYLHPDYPRVWDLNYLEVETDDPPFIADDLAGEAERILGDAGIGHRRVTVADEDVAAPLVDRFKELEWMINRFLYMSLQRDPSGTAGANRAREIDRDEHRETYIATAAEAPFGTDPDVIRQLAGQTDLIAATNDVRYFGAVDQDGTLASICVLFSDGGTAQIEDVATLKQYRNRGLATDLLLVAIAAAKTAGNELIFLVADDEDWPKELYGKLGFEPIGRSYDFVMPGDVVFANDNE
jgi:ribosomal protein S18 acetylase RimI-like enzyme